MRVSYPNTEGTAAKGEIPSEFKARRGCLVSAKEVNLKSIYVSF